MQKPVSLSFALLVAALPKEDCVSYLLRPQAGREKPEYMLRCFSIKSECGYKPAMFFFFKEQDGSFLCDHCHMSASLVLWLLPQDNELQ